MAALAGAPAAGRRSRTNGASPRPSRRAMRRPPRGPQIVGCAPELDKFVASDHASPGAGRARLRAELWSRARDSAWYPACSLVFHLTLPPLSQPATALQSRRRKKGRMVKTKKDVLGFAQDKKTAMVDLKFMDFLGLWQHFTIPLAELTEAVFDEGLGFDGSSIRGWMPIDASDMLVVPDPATAVMDPFMKDATLSLICNIVDPITKEPYSRDPRFIAQKAEAYLKKTGVGDVAYFGPEAE